MRVGMYYSNSDVRVQEMPAPKIGAGELLVRVRASGICGSDAMEWYRRDRVPLVLGHEIGAEIVEVGKGVTRYKKGQRITAAHHLPCNKCRFCRMGHPTTCDTLRRTNFDPGGFAEYARLAAINVRQGVFLLPEDVSYEEATFVEPLACVLRAQRLAGLSACPAGRRPAGQKAKSVLVIGCGVSGLLHIKSAKFKGASCIAATDVVEYRLKAGKRSGAGLAINSREYNPEAFRQINNGLLADVVIVCTGAAAAIGQAINSVERGGVILFFAPVANNANINIPFNNLFWRNEITLTSSYAASPAEHTEALKLIAAGKIKVAELITHRLPLEKIGDGFKLVAGGMGSLKVIIEPQK